MKQEQLYFLREDATGYCSGIEYGFAGQPVTLISKLEDHVDTVIVADIDGERFPVRREKLTQNLEEKEAPPAPSLPETSQRPVFDKSTPTPERTKPIQQSLF